MVVHAAAGMALQPDVVRAFAMREHKVFLRANGQVYAIVGVNPDLLVVSDVWFGGFDSQNEFKDVLVHVLDLIRNGKMRYWLADLRFLASDFGPSEDWLVKTLMPAVIGAGLEREAVVLPGAAIAKEGEDIYRTASTALRDIADGRVRGFTDISLAKRWLLEGALPDSSA